MRFVRNKIVEIIVVWFDDVTKWTKWTKSRYFKRQLVCAYESVVILAYIVLRSILFVYTLFETIATATAYISKRFLSGLLFTQANSFTCTQYPHKK